MGLSFLPSPVVPAVLLLQLLLLLLTMVTTVSPFVMSPHPSHQARREGTSHRLPFAFVRPIQHQPLFVAPERMDYSIPECITSSVLKQVYPSLVQWREEYGHPNIPLGTPEGRMCQTLRRLQIQQKLTDTEIQLLQDIGFRFSSLEDVYHELDFNVMLTKLIAYEQQEQNQYQVPKKYAPDPELGAWVTGIRRVYAAAAQQNNSNKNHDTSQQQQQLQQQQGVVDPHHIERLDAIGFTWISERKCGSKFMSQYRELVSQLDAASVSAADEETELTMKRNEILKQEKVQTWIAAQRDARRRGGLSDTRFHYMQQLLGDDWMDE